VPAHADYLQLRIIDEKRGNWTLAQVLAKGLRLKAKRTTGINKSLGSSRN
jgi:hypothetical protein